MTDIMRDVGIAINQIQQVTPIITGYLLGYIAAMPLLGRASDRFGRKLLLQASLAGFAVGSVVTALSTDLTTLVIGRVIQGIASGALLPVTLALAADLWARPQPRRGARRHRRRPGTRQRARPAVRHRGGLAAAPPGATCSGSTCRWPRIAMVMIHFSLPSQQKDRDRRRRSTSSAACCSRSRWAWPSSACTTRRPTASRCCPAGGCRCWSAALVAAVAFFVWERFARTRLIEPAGVHFRPFLAALGASLAAGAALMVTLVNVELFGQGVLGMDQNQAAFLLLRFLVALPIGALLGGWIATKVGDRAVAFAGLLIAAGGYWLSRSGPWTCWRPATTSVCSRCRRWTPIWRSPGLGLGLVIAPLTSAALRVVPAAQHGIASAAVVVARMIGMLVGVAALSAWGLYKFNQYPAERCRPARAPATPWPDWLRRRSGTLPSRRTSCSTARSSGSPRSSASSGALLGLLISGRNEHADEPEPEPADAGRRAHPADRHPDAGIPTRRDADADIRAKRGPDSPASAAAAAAVTDPVRQSDRETVTSDSHSRNALWNTVSRGLAARSSPNPDRRPVSTAPPHH